MPKYLPPDTIGGTLAIAICYRCKRKIYYGELQTDPNNLQKYCKECVDIYDPYRLPARAPDLITLQYPRPDEDLVVPDDYPYDSDGAP